MWVLKSFPLCILMLQFSEGTNDEMPRCFMEANTWTYVPKTSGDTLPAHEQHS